MVSSFSSFFLETAGETGCARSEASRQPKDLTSGFVAEILGSFVAFDGAV